MLNAGVKEQVVLLKRVSVSDKHCSSKNVNR